jgi:hypothetical protein
MAENESMPESKAELDAHIAREWDALQATVAGLSEEQLVRPGGGGWSIKDNLYHIAAWEQVLVEAVLGGQTTAEALGVAPGSLQGLDEDGINDLIYRQSRALSLPAVLERARQAHQQVLDVLARTPFEALLKPLHPDRSEPVLDWVAGNTYDHYREHRLYIERLAGQ